MVLKYRVCHSRKIASDLSTYSSSAAGCLLILLSPPPLHCRDTSNTRNEKLAYKSELFSPHRQPPIRLGNETLFPPSTKQVPPPRDLAAASSACTLFFSPVIQCSATPALRERAIFPPSILLTSTSGKSPSPYHLSDVPQSRAQADPHVGKRRPPFRAMPCHVQAAVLTPEVQSCPPVFCCLFTLR